MSSPQPDEVDELIAARASADPDEVLRARVAALEAETRRLAMADAVSQERARRAFWLTCAGLWVLAATLPWLADGDSRLSLARALVARDHAAMVALSVVVPAAFVGVLAWRLPRAGAAAMVVLAAWLAATGVWSTGPGVQIGPALAASVLVAAAVRRWLARSD